VVEAWNLVGIYVDLAILNKFIDMGPIHYQFESIATGISTIKARHYVVYYSSNIKKFPYST